MIAIEQAMVAVIEATVPAAKEVMEWLQKIATQAAEKNLPLWWWSPVGFPVVLEKHKTEQYRVFENVNGHTARPPFQLPVVPITMDAREMRQAVAAYFVHSYDAAHLMLVVDTARRSGIESLAVEHDCYGTVAADMPLLGQIIRQRFVDMYIEHDPLAKMYDMAKRMKLNPRKLPARGQLKIEEAVLDSPYFFA